MRKLAFSWYIMHPRSSSSELGEVGSEHSSAWLRGSHSMPAHCSVSPKPYFTTWLFQNWSFIWRLASYNKNAMTAVMVMANASQVLVQALFLYVVFQCPYEVILLWFPFYIWDLEARRRLAAGKQQTHPEQGLWSLLLQLRCRKALWSPLTLPHALQGLRGPVARLSLQLTPKQDVGIPLSRHPFWLLLHKASSTTFAKIPFQAPPSRVASPTDVLHAGDSVLHSAQSSLFQRGLWGPRAPGVPSQLPAA